MPVENGELPLTVFGQPDFEHNDCNRGGSANNNTLCAPVAVYTVFGAIFVADTANNRILLWFDDPYVASFVWGQPDFTSNSPNRGGSPTGNSFYLPYDMSFDSSSSTFILADMGNNRVLVWDALPMSYETMADAVLGQSDFSSASINKGGSVGARTLWGPSSVSLLSTVGLYVLDGGNNRLVAYLNTDDPAAGIEDEEEDGGDGGEEEPEVIITRSKSSNKSKKEKCVATKPVTTSWIKMTPKTVNGIKGIQLTWTQYMADKVTIKIDDGTGSYPWQIDKTLNDGHEFLPNVDISQKIMLKPYNQCAEGNYSEAVSYNSHARGWFNFNLF